MNEIVDIEKYENELRNNQGEINKLSKLKQYMWMLQKHQRRNRNTKVNNQKVNEVQQRLNSIIEFLDSDEVRLDDPVIMKQLIKQIKVINKYALELKMVCGINVKKLI